ncbi:oxidoreductase [Capsulimonas corticalis]|uniref:Oxidoreductase n=2 Tax=Capsulimonas corticalis TaxID=2219043 RepID=A0A402D2T0_9BACT|nr:oxidoreductase [Capsulimonas corticalis]
MQMFDVGVIGAGSAGPKAARTAARMGASVVIFEESRIGGECLYTGCVPSKALLHSATLWNRILRAPEFGLPQYEGAALDFGAVMAHARRTIERVGAGDATESFTRAGIVTVCERASFVDPNTVIAGAHGERYQAKQWILCTGSRPSIPNIPGLEDAGCDTNRTVFGWTDLPRRIVVIGGGPIGCELGQVFARFGAQVTIILSGSRILERDDADAACVVSEMLAKDRIELRPKTTIERVERRGGEKVLHLRGGGEIVCDAILVAAGRRSNTEGVNLEAAGVRLAEHGRLKTDGALRTNVPHIWAAGDVATEYKFTHAVSYEGAVTATNAVNALRGEPPIKADYHVVPRVTYTDPELASVGLTPAMARQTHGAEMIDVSRFPFDALDRAIIDGATEGFAQIVSRHEDGAIIGAQIVGEHAGSLISEICLAMRSGLCAADIALTMHAYPTLPEAVEAAADGAAHAPLSPNIPRAMTD